MMKKYVLPILLLALSAGVLLPPSSASAAERPNVLLIMVDDLGKDWISCYGADDIETPNIDALAAGGMKFTNAWSMPQCTPTRVTLLTGQYPWRTGWVNHWDVPRWGVGYFDWKKYTTFAELMKSTGYRTAIAGKWQINDFRVEPNALEKHGFDDWCVWTGGEGGNPVSGKRYWDPYIHTREGSRTYDKKFGPDIYCDFLVDFINQHQDQPMMLYFPMCLTHGPLVHTPHEPNADAKLDKHKAMVRYTDHLVGRLVETIDSAGIRDDTIIIFTTDNGTSGGLRGTIDGKRPRGGKASKYEGGVCEPFIVNGPGIVPRGATTDVLTDFSDLLPTFAELAGAKVPDDLVIDGESFAPLLLGKADDSPRDWIMALGHGAARLDEEGVRGVHDYADRVIRDKQFKVWVDPNKKITQLYDLRRDPLEKNNLIDSDQPEHLAALRKFQQIVDATPDQDARPQYREREPNPWDRELKQQAWRIDGRRQWKKNRAQSEGLRLNRGVAEPTKKRASYRSVVKTFDKPRKAKTLTIRQSAAWDNWTPVPNVGPEGTTNAPVFLPVADGDYWFFAAKKGAGRGYHAWRSSDMKNWKHLGKVAWSHWVTTAEYADGKIYLYYDEPNDQDPHLMLGENLDGDIQWTDHGEVLADPSHGSDAGVLRTTDGTFHLFYEDWSPINARQHSWDSPLAGHADSADGIHGFKPHEHPAPIDKRTEPTGRSGSYKHVSSEDPLKYEIHQPEQDAYGDYTAIQLGDRFYLFCDYDPHDAPMRVGYWSSDSINGRFKWGGDVGMGFHPDPTIGFAEGKFYLIVQRAKEDFVSPGPWVDQVTAKVGVDVDGDGKVDEWTKRQSVRETYAKKPGFARVVETTPASLDASGLPAGRGFCIEFSLEDTTDNASKPILDRVELTFQ